MATGIQTGMRTRRSGLSPQPQKTNYLKTATTFWGGLSKKAKMLGVGSVLLAFVLLGATHNNVQSNRYIDLYPIKMNVEDVRNVSMELTSAGIDHSVAPTNDSIQVHPESRIRAQALLAGVGLPQFKAMGIENKNSVATTRDMRVEQRRMKLESDIAQTLRAMKGIRGARVKIAEPERTYFGDDSKFVKASVFLDLQPGFEISQSMAQGIGALVAHSVPELQRENVSIHDSKGERILVKPAPESMHMKIQMERQTALKRELLESLRHIYGDRCHASVNLTLDFSHEEVRRYTPGSVEDGGVVRLEGQIVREQLDKDNEDGKDDKDYLQEKEAYRNKVREMYYARLREFAEVKRITATVLVDGADEDQVDSIKQLAAGCLGVDESRADVIFVNTTPWQRNPMPEETGGSGAVTEAPVTDQTEQSASLALWLTMTGLAGIVLGLSAAFLTSRTKPFLVSGAESSGMGQPHGIVDHGQNKNGETTVYGDETLQGTRLEALEKLVRHQPTKSAELLKTWMN